MSKASVHNMQQAIPYLALLITGAVTLTLVPLEEHHWSALSLDHAGAHENPAAITRSAIRHDDIVCCRTSKPPTTQKAKEAMMGCQHHIQDGGTNGHMTQWQTNREDKKRFICFTQCTAKEIGMVDNEGFMVEDSWLQVVQKHENISESLKAVRKEAVKNCTTFANGYVKREKLTMEEHKCNAAALNAAVCFKLQVEVNCPEELKITGFTCEIFRSKAYLDLKKLNATT